MNLHIFYRAKDDVGAGPRPEYFHKRRCFENFVAEFGNEMVAVVDGDVPRWLLTKKLIVLDSHGEKTEEGKASTFIECYKRAIELPDDDWTYFVEDDYLHLPGSRGKLIDCIEELCPDMITLYDHPDRYRTDIPEHNPAHHTHSVFVTKSHHWRPVPSTCMTFAASVIALKEGRELFEQWKHVDFELFPRLQGLRGDWPGRKMLLLGPVPSLATHCQTNVFAPLIDWSKV